MSNLYVKSLENKNVFYVYVLLDPNYPGEFEYGDLKFDHQPYYVGKGAFERSYWSIADSLKGDTHNPIKSYVAQKIARNGFDPYQFVVYLKKELSEKDAFGLENSVIVLIGRRDLEEGPLTNLTDGGEGWTGAISPSKGKTYEEIYGEKKGRELRELRRKNCFFTNPDFIPHEERYGQENADKMIQSAREGNSGVKNSRSNKQAMAEVPS